MTLVQFEPKSIKIGEDYSAMQGPCNSGYHIPTKDEWQSVYNIGSSLGAWTSTGGVNFATYLHLPMAGSRSGTNSNAENQGSNGNYACCSISGIYIYSISFGSNYIYQPSAGMRTNGYSIRPFKDTPVTPSGSGWTTVYQGTGNAGIYWNSSDGVISLSYDGSNWITMSDKNLGATNVYNYGYSLIEAFCGKYYQWGNNYGFPFTGSVTTSTTKPNASSYGPGNYYSSSTFIVVTASPYDRSSVQNDNLRGGVTGVVQKDIKKVYLGSTQVRPNLPYLCFTANTAGSTIKLNKVGTPNDVNLEICTDNITRTSYTIGDTITLNNTGDKVYWRTTSETDTGFSKDYNNYYKFSMTGSIAASGDVNYLLNKNSTLTASGGCFSFLFDSCSSLTSTPILPATTLASNCYDRMFRYCSNLETLPKLPALSLVGGCYYQMFAFCSKIKLSTTQTGEYQTPYRIPYEGEGTSSGITMQQMFASTGGTRAGMGTPSINTTYYTSNTVV